MALDRVGLPTPLCLRSQEFNLCSQLLLGSPTEVLHIHFSQQGY